MGSRLLLVAALSAAVATSAARAASSGRDLTAYTGLGTWLDLYAKAAWVDPERPVTAMAADGIETLYLQTGNYEQRDDLVRPRALGRFLDAAHAAGLRVVAWYLPSLADPAQDERRALAAVRFRSPSGERFDSFALDIEASVVQRVPLRNRRLLQLSARIRAAAGSRYPLGAIIPSPVAMGLHPSYWPGFPYKALARYYDVFLPMAYSTDYDKRGSTATLAYVTASIAAVRTDTGNADIPVHVIGGITDRMGGAETAGFLQAVADCVPVGYSLYEFPTTSARAWAALNTALPAPAGGDPSCA